MRVAGGLTGSGRRETVTTADGRWRGAAAEATMEWHSQQALAGSTAAASTRRGEQHAAERSTSSRARSSRTQAERSKRRRLPPRPRRRPLPARGPALLREQNRRRWQGPPALCPLPPPRLRCAGCSLAVRRSRTPRPGWRVRAGGALDGLTWPCPVRVCAPCMSGPRGDSGAVRASCAAGAGASKAGKPVKPLQRPLAAPAAHARPDALAALASGGQLRKMVF